MDREEAVRFAEDLETGAFRRGDVERHRIALDIQNLAYGNEVCFEEYWDGRG